jgi:hypothetical protein
MEPLTIILLIISGLGAGVVTGLVGASAAVAVTPILVTFLNYPAFTAIGISLATDIFASSTSAKNYYNYGHLDIKNGITLTILAIIGAFIGSALSKFIPDSMLGRGAGIAILIIGINFLRKPMNKRIKEFKDRYKFNFVKKHKLLSTIIFGLLIGLICGMVGAGGGIMILMILTFVLGYEIKTAIGTSVLIMTFIALSGAIGHFIHTGVPYVEILIAGISSIIGAAVASRFANKASEDKLSKVIGVTFIVLAVVMIVKRFLN